MTMKSLAEAAAEVLNKSRADSQKEPMHKLTGTGSGLENVVDLGGSTYENPQGGDLGVKAAAARGVANPPGVQPDASSKQGMEKLGVDDDPESGGREGSAAAKKVSDQKAGEKSSPDEQDDGRGADHGRFSGSYVKPTVHSEETEIDEDGEVLEASDEELDDDAIAEAREERWENAKNKMKEFSVAEDIDAIFSGDETFSEEFKEKVATIFEGAVIARAVMVAEALEEEILDAAQEALDDAKIEIEEQVDTYLNFVVENWVKENQVAIESGLRSEIVEDFISGLKNLFAENYIDVPEEKVDVVEEQAQEIASLQEQINEILNSNAELSKEIAIKNQESILASVSEGLTATQAAKLKTLTEGVEFTTEGEYTNKLNVIRESYFANGNKTVKQDNTNIVHLVETVEPVQIEEETNSAMSAYVNVLNRTQNI
jgi:hypothetical protein